MGNAGIRVGSAIGLAAKGVGVGLLTLLGACSPVGMAIGAAATVGVKASEERGIVTSVGDDVLWTEINAAWLDSDPVMFQKLMLQVHEGRALITGMVQEPEMRVEAVRIAWQTDGVKEVINEIGVAETDDLGGNLQDLVIIQALKGKLLIDSGVRSINYSIESVRGTIYLMGIAQDETELKRVIDHARDISYVKRVVSYVRIKDAA
jgi:osmotically-inducible protein OsmY